MFLDKSDSSCFTLTQINFLGFLRFPTAGEMICVANYSVSTIFTILDALAQAPQDSILTPADDTT